MVSSLSRIGAEEDDTSLANNLVRTSEQGHVYTKQFDILLALPYIAPITAITRFPEYRLYYVHEIVQWPFGKVICHTLKYMRDH